MIKFVDRKNIDDDRWNEVIALSAAETLYPYSWYLDAAAEHWSALIMDDYRFIMPLVWNRKLGISYLYQPFYTQQLGVFSKDYTDPVTISAMLSRVPKKFIYGHMHFNSGNLVGEQGPFVVDDRKNYRLTLQASHESLKQSYSNNTRRNIQRALALDEGVRKDIAPEVLVSLKKRHDIFRRPESSYRWLLRLLETIKKNGNGVIYGSMEGEEPDAAAFFAFSRTRAIYLVAVSSERGKQRRSMFKVVDAFIADHAGSGMILDFEGSSIPSVARFFSGFGAHPEVFQRVRFNRLAVPLKSPRRHA
ncbi:MAG TPA: hypothetical protein ENO05_00285 [Bacteroides sp.]|nr:hypothetical protein [Bacteroides sp.]